MLALPHGDQQWQDSATLLSAGYTSRLADFRVTVLGVVSASAWLEINAGDVHVDHRADPVEEDAAQDDPR